MKKIATALALIAGLGLAGTVYAADTVPGATSETTQSGNSIEALALSNPDILKGKEVQSESGKKIGDVSKLVRSNASQDIYAVVSAGGFLGVGDTEVAVPVKDLMLKGEDTIVMSQNAESMLKSHAYDPANFTDLAKSGDTDSNSDTGTTR